jgi:hypothetical protein
MLGDVEDRHHVRRGREPGCGGRLAAEPRSRVVLSCIPVREQLDGDGPRQHGIRRTIHLPHPAVSDELG